MFPCILPITYNMTSTPSPLPVFTISDKQIEFISILNKYEIKSGCYPLLPGTPLYKEKTGRTTAIAIAIVTGLKVAYFTNDLKSVFTLMQRFNTIGCPAKLSINCGVIVLESEKFSVPIETLETNHMRHRINDDSYLWIVDHITKDMSYDLLENRAWVIHDNLI